MSNLGKIFGTKNQGMEIDMSNDPAIAHVEIDFTGGLYISSVAGNNIKSIEISGSELTIKNLCIFVSARNLKKSVA